MVKRVFNMQGGAHSAAAYTAFENAAYGSCVANVDSLKVSVASGMTAHIAPGDGIISTPNSGKRIQSDVVETVTVSAANATFNRIDSVVVYIDSAVAPSTAVIDNVNNILKFAVVAGTASGNPVAPNEATIQATIGAGNSYMVLADILVPSGVTSVNTATFIDRRHVATLINSSNLAKKAVKADNIDYTTMQFGSLVQVESKSVTLPRNIDTVVLNYSLNQRAIAIISASDLTNKINILVNGTVVGYISGSGTITIPINKGSVVSIQNTVAASISMWLRSSYIPM